MSAVKTAELMQWTGRRFTITRRDTDGYLNVAQLLPMYDCILAAEVLSADQKA